MKRTDKMRQTARFFSWLILLFVVFALPVKAGIVHAAALDQTAPVLHFVSLDKTIGAAGDYLTITLDVEDDLSGVDDYYLMVSYTSPDRETEKYIYPDLSSNGLYRGRIPVEKEDAAGTWQIISVRLDDLAGNTRKVYNSALDPASGEVMDLSSGDYRVGYQVAFNSRGGSIINPRTVSPGESLNAPKAPVRPGYTFSGWFKEPALLTPWDFSLDRASESVTLYAGWVGTPSHVKAQSVGYDRIGLTWWQPEGASQYKIYRATSLSGTYRYIATTANTFYTDQGRTTGRTYYYKVRGFDPTTQTSGPSSTAVKAKPVPAPPSSFKAVHLTSASIRTSWNSVSGATGYEVWRSLSEGGTYYLRRSTSSLSYTNTSLTSGRTYYYKVRAYRLVDGRRIYSSWSPVRSARPW